MSLFVEISFKMKYQSEYFFYISSDTDYMEFYSNIIHNVNEDLTCGKVFINFYGKKRSYQIAQNITRKNNTITEIIKLEIILHSDLVPSNYFLPLYLKIFLYVKALSLFQSLINYFPFICTLYYLDNQFQIT